MSNQPERLVKGEVRFLRLTRPACQQPMCEPALFGAKQKSAAAYLNQLGQCGIWPFFYTSSLHNNRGGITEKCCVVRPLTGERVA